MMINRCQARQQPLPSMICPQWVIFDRCRRSCRPVHVRFAPKATDVLRCREMIQGAIRRHWINFIPMSASLLKTDFARHYRHVRECPQTDIDWIGRSEEARIASAAVVATRGAKNTLGSFAPTGAPFLAPDRFNKKDKKASRQASPRRMVRSNRNTPA